jgi:dUTP pyrophosphatase
MDQDLKKLQEEIKKIQESFGISDDDNNFDEVFDSFGLNLKELENDMENFSQKRELGYSIIHPDSIPPKYNYGTDSGFDLHSVEEVILKPFGRSLVPTGLCFDISDGYELQIRPKSGLAINQGLTILNTPGTVDCGYTGEIKVIVFNTNPEEFIIKKGMKVGQAVLCPVVNGRWVELIQVDTIKEKDRNSAGFGSTGI